MAKNPLNRVEENTEIGSSERIKNSVKNFQLSLLVHLMILFQHSFKFFFLQFFQHLKIPIFHLFYELEKIGKSSLEQHSNIPVLNLFVHGEKFKYSLTPTFKNLNFQSMGELGKQLEFT